MTKKEFRKIVTKAIDKIPAQFLKKLDNVAIVVEDEPNFFQKTKLHLRRGWSLFGLYEGVPQVKRGSGYSGVLPDKITIFQKPIEAAAYSQEDIEEIVKNTVWHEIAHHFGMNEKEVREAERRRRQLRLNKKSPS